MNNHIIKFLYIVTLLAYIMRLRMSPKKLILFALAVGTTWMAYELQLLITHFTVNVDSIVISFDVNFIFQLSEAPGVSIPV